MSTEKPGIPAYTRAWGERIDPPGGMGLHVARPERSCRAAQATSITWLSARPVFSAGELPNRCARGDPRQRVGACPVTKGLPECQQCLTCCLCSEELARAVTLAGSACHISLPSRSLGLVSLFTRPPAFWLTVCEVGGTITPPFGVVFPSTRRNWPTASSGLRATTIWVPSHGLQQNLSPGFELAARHLAFWIQQIAHRVDDGVRLPGQRKPHPGASRHTGNNRLRLHPSRANEAARVRWHAGVCWPLEL
jgi:hypothetical protein